MTISFNSDGEATRAIKSALRKAFPAAKFSVTRGGAQIEWEDTGPTVEQVKDALISAEVVTTRKDWRGELALEVPGNSLSNSIWFVCFNTAKREADKADAERRAEEYEQQRQRESEAVREAAKARATALARPLGISPPVENTLPAFEVFEQLRQRAEQDVAADDDTERQRRPSWAPPLILGDELHATCVELGLLQPDDKPIARLWAEFADPKKRGTVLREQRSSLPLHGITCRGFELHAGTERGRTLDILFEAQRDKDGKWRFGPHPFTMEYRSTLDSKWKRRCGRCSKFRAALSR